MSGMLERFFRSLSKVRPAPSCKYRGQAVGSPALDSEVMAAEEAIGFVFPDQIRDLYKSHNGLDTQGDPGCIPGFMPLDLVVSMHTPDKSGWLAAVCVRYGLVAFWEDYESNYIAVRVADPGQGMVAVIQHDNACFAPRYRTIDSYLDRVESAAMDGTEWFDWDTDYPLPNAVDGREVSTREFFWQKTETCEKDDVSAWFEMGANLVSRQEVGILVPFLDSSDRVVQAIVTKLIARAAQPDAIDHMKRMILYGRNPARWAAIRGITQIAGQDGMQILESLASDTSPEIQKYIKQHVAYIHRSIKRGFDPFKIQGR